MRSVTLLPLAAVAALLAGCAGEKVSTPDRTTSAGATAAAEPKRDLTLQTQPTPTVEVASAVELTRLEPKPRPERRARVSRKPAPAPQPEPEDEAAPAAEAAVAVAATEIAEVLVEPAPAEDLAASGGRELAPGRTVTIIPATAGPSTTSEEPEWIPSERGRSMVIGSGRGGRCRPRGGVRGIGIAGRIPVGLPGRRLR